MSKNIVYCGGLEPEVDENALRDLFSPFGEVLSVLIPFNDQTSTIPFITSLGINNRQMKAEGLVLLNLRIQMMPISLSKT